MCICKEKWIHFWCVKKGQVHHPISHKENKREQREASQEWQRGTRFIFLVWSWRRELQRGEESIKRRNEENNQHLWNNEKEKRTTETMRVNREIHHLTSQEELQWQIHFSSSLKSHEEKNPPVNLEEGQIFLTWQQDKSNYEQGSCPHFLPSSHRKLPCLRKGQIICFWTLEWYRLENKEEQRKSRWAKKLPSKHKRGWNGFWEENTEWKERLNNSATFTVLWGEMKNEREGRNHCPYF